RVVARADTHAPGGQRQLAGVEHLAEQLLAHAGVEAMQREARRIGERAAEAEDVLVLVGRVDRDRVGRGAARFRPRQARLLAVPQLARRRPYRDSARRCGKRSACAQHASGERAHRGELDEVTAIEFAQAILLASGVAESYVTP